MSKTKELAQKLAEERDKEVIECMAEINATLQKYDCKISVLAVIDGEGVKPIKTPLTSILNLPLEIAITSNG